MNNPNPIYYRDLVTPDSAVTDLISQLTTLIAKYDELKKNIQSDAAQMAASLKNVSSATDEQRETIANVNKESDKLAQAYSKITDSERLLYREQQNVNRAKKEQQQIDKLIVQLNNSAEGSYNRLSAQYRLNKIRLNEMSEAERHGTEAGRALETESRRIYERMSDLQKATGKYTLEVGHYENAMRALPAPLRTLTTGLSQMGTTLHEIGTSSLPIGAKALQGFGTIALGTIGIIISFVNHLTTAYRTMRDFEQANADLSTILGVSRKDMQALTNTALQLGRTTEYTASQVTQLQTELAKLGFGQGSIIAMQKSVLQFATAVGANLADAAAVAGSTLRAFNLLSKDTDEALATLAVSTNKSALSFSRIQESIGTVFPVANAYGLTLKDTIALLGALANAGFDASSAATATRNILLNLANANGALAKSLGGSVKTFDDIIDGLIKLRKAGIDVGEALELTDKRSVAAFSAFISGAESARELRRSLEDVSGELDRIQEERLDTVTGSTKLLASAWEGLTLAMSKSNGAIKSTIDWLTRLIEKTQIALFPEETFQTSTAEKFTEKFRKYYEENGAEAARAYIETMIKNTEKWLADADKAVENSPFLNKFLGWGPAQTTQKSAELSLAGIREAAQIILSQIENDGIEAAQQAQRAADQAKQEASERQKILTKEQLKEIERQKKQRVADRKAVVESINLEIAATDKGTDKMLQLRIDKINAERQVELELNRQRVESEKRDEKKINDKYDKEILDAKKAFEKEKSQLAVQSLQAELNAINLQIAVTRKGTDEMLALRIAAIDKQREIELAQNRQKAEKLRQDEKVINAKYYRQMWNEEIDFNAKIAMETFSQQQALAASEFELLNRNERQKTQFRLQMERERLEKILQLNRQNGKELTKEQRKTLENQIDAIKKESDALPFNNIYEVLGLNIDKKTQKGIDLFFNQTLQNINELMNAWAQEAEAAIAAAQARVESAKSALDAEIEARNNGYANNVVQAQKELELERQREQDALEEKRKYQKAQLAIDTVMQTTSLITATANIWASLSKIPIVGYVLAISAIATMWASFAAAKVKAAQITKQETYGEGTVELLEGGSHASGHDIDLGTKKDGTRRRAEGGEYFAVINKRNSRRYGQIIPDVINAFNDGTFADKYQRANTAMAGMAISMFNAPSTDVSKLEKDVHAIRTQGDESVYVDKFGNTIIKYKNLKKIIKS